MVDNLSEVGNRFLLQSRIYLVNYRSYFYLKSFFFLNINQKREAKENHLLLMICASDLLLQSMESQNTSDQLIIIMFYNF